jgi:MATE family multidrug resistance protein
VTAGALPAGETFGARLGRHLAALGALAWPVMLSRAGILVMSVVSVAMLGRHSTVALAEAALAIGLFIPVMVTGVGLQVGVISIVARRHGAGRTGECVDAWRRALPWATLSGLAGAAILAFSETWLSLIGQSPALAAGGGAAGRAMAPGALFQIIYIVGAFYLEGTGRPKPALAAMAAANLLNVALCWALIHGRLGAPDLGAVGAGLAGTAVRGFLAAAVTLYILRLPEVRAAGGLRRFGGLWGPGGWAAGAEMRRLGYASGVAYGAETTAYAALTQMAGLIGAPTLAAYSILHNIEALVFMAALGLSVATGVRVGAAAGAGRRDEAAFAGWTGLGAALAAMGATGAALWLWAPGAVSVYTADAGVAASAVGAMGIVALIVAPDGGQIVMGQANRALGDAWASARLFVLAYWLWMVPLAALLAFGAGLGLAGLMWGTLGGALASLCLQSARFARLSGSADAQAVPPGAVAPRPDAARVRPAGAAAAPPPSGAARSRPTAAPVPAVAASLRPGPSDGVRSPAASSPPGAATAAGPARAAPWVPPAAAHPTPAAAPSRPAAGGAPPRDRRPGGAAP